MSTQVNIHEAKTHLSQLVERACEGEDIVVAKAGEPKVRLVPVVSEGKRRKPGSAKGLVKVHDSFFDPLPDDLLDAFEK